MLVAATLPRKDVRHLVEGAYRRAGELHCCDPRDLSDALGLVPCPTRTEMAFVQDGVLHYPEASPLPRRGLAMYRLIAKHLWPTLNPFPLMLELILPEVTARSACFPELATMQPHAPIALVQSIYMSHGRSGVMRAIRPE